VQGAGTSPSPQRNALRLTRLKFLLAIVLVGEDHDGPYCPPPFEAEPGWGVASINFEIKRFMSARRRRS
jgi:hypothetical protein